MSTRKTTIDNAKLDRLVADARRTRDQRDQGYRARALALFAWVCARCAREFTNASVSQLTVHHKDGNHDNNPPDGSNWELLCVYCHENEHARVLDHALGDAAAGRASSAASHRPFADLAARLKGRK
jgi:predicted HNH restriction endonuclease